MASLGMVKKLIQQRRHTGCIENLHHRAGRNRLLTAQDDQRLLQLHVEQPVATLAQLRDRLGIDCHITMIDKALRRLGLRLKKLT